VQAYVSIRTSSVTNIHIITIMVIEIKYDDDDDDVTLVRHKPWYHLAGTFVRSQVTLY